MLSQYRNSLAGFLVLAVLVVGCVGCLRRSDPPVSEFSTYEATQEFFGTPDATPLPPADSVSVTDRSAEAGSLNNFTGALIWTTPATCLPCRYLDADLRWLAKNHRWSYGSETDGDFDWTVAADSPLYTGEKPCIQFYQHGKPVKRIVGYLADDDSARRLDFLSNIVRQHPSFEP